MSEIEEDRTICEDCGRTIPKPPEVRGYEIVPLCPECIEKRKASY